MRTKKVLALVLVACLALACLTGCGAKKEAAKFKVGMVTDVGGVNDQSFNQYAWAGLQNLAKENAAFEVNYLESKTDADYQGNIESFLDDKYDLIVCVGYMLATATREAALANPNQKFAIIDDSTNADLPNVACLMFDQHVGSYLAGIVAGLATQSNTVGYVQGMVSDTMNMFGVGFTAGVLDTNPNAKVLQYNANSFADAAIGSTAAQDMFTKGADVIYQAAGGTGVGVISTCAENKIWAIGVDADQSGLAPDYVLTSVMKRCDNAVQDVAKAAKDGKFAGGVRQYGMANDGVDLAPTDTHLTDAMKTAVADAKKKIAAGEITVPSTVAELEAKYPGTWTLGE